MTRSLCLFFVAPSVSPAVTASVWLFYVTPYVPSLWPLLSLAVTPSVSSFKSLIPLSLLMIQFVSSLWLHLSLLCNSLCLASQCPPLTLLFALGSFEPGARSQRGGGGGCVRGLAYCLYRLLVLLPIACCLLPIVYCGLELSRKQPATKHNRQ